MKSKLTNESFKSDKQNQRIKTPYFSNIFHNRIKKIQHVPSVKNLSTLNNPTILRISSYILPKPKGFERKTIDPLTFSKRLEENETGYASEIVPGLMINKINTNSKELLSPYLISSKDTKSPAKTPSKPNLPALPPLFIHSFYKRDRKSQTPINSSEYTRLL